MSSNKLAANKQFFDKFTSVDDLMLKMNQSLSVLSDQISVLNRNIQLMRSDQYTRHVSQAAIVQTTQERPNISPTTRTLYRFNNQYYEDIGEGFGPIAVTVAAGSSYIAKFTKTDGDTDHYFLMDYITMWGEIDSSAEYLTCVAHVYQNAKTTKGNVKIDVDNAGAISTTENLPIESYMKAQLSKTPITFVLDKPIYMGSNRTWTIEFENNDSTYDVRGRGVVHYNHISQVNFNPREKNVKIVDVR